MRRVIVLVSTVVALTAAVLGQESKPPALSPDQQLLHNIADSFGMLRTTNEEDMIATVRYWGKGTLIVDGQPCRLASYAASVNYHVPGSRIEYTCVAGNGQAASRHIEVVAGTMAWNEDTPGGNATPAMQTAAERILNVWTLPHGAVKAAVLAGSNLKVTTENGATVLTFPVPSMDATMKLTLNAVPIKVVIGSSDLIGQPLAAGTVIERVETRRGAMVTETTYSGFGDFNGSDYFSDVVFPRRIVQKRGGTTVLDLTVDKTNTYNPYVVLPVPQNVRAAQSTALNR